MAYAGPPYDPGFWIGNSCNKIWNFCFACSAEEMHVLRMRGLCEEDKKAIYFYFSNLKNNFKYDIL